MEKKSNIFEKVENTLWLLCITLDSFYFYNIGLSLIAILGACYSIKFFLIDRKPIPKSCAVPLVVLLCLIIISLITSFPNSHLFLEKRFFLILILFPVIIYVSYLLTYRPLFFSSVIKNVLTIHILFLVIQLFYFYFVSGEFLDYLKPFTGEAQRALGGSYTIGGSKLIRATGLFNEPGTYSTFVFILYLMYYSLNVRYKENYKLRLFDYVAIISVLSTFSIFGFVFVTLFLIHYLWTASLKVKLISLILFIPFILLVLEIYISKRFALGAENAGVGFRSQILIFYIQNIEEYFFNFLFGYSIFLDYNKFFNVRFIFNDLGFWFTILLYIGILPFITFLIIFRKNILRFFILFLIIMLCKLTITTIFLWIAITVITNESYQHNNEKYPNLLSK